MCTTYELHAFIEDGGKKKPFHVRISAPQASAEDDFYCQVHAPELFTSDKEIFGIDAAQARELAVQFVKSLLVGKQLVSDTGQLIDVDQLTI